MKKYFLIGLFIIFVALANTTKAQIFLGEAFVGYNLSQVDHDHYNVMEFHRSGLQVGVGVLTPIWQKNNFSIDLSLEVLFNQKGSYQAKTKQLSSIYVTPTHDTIHKTGEYDLRLNYGEVPIMVYFTSKKMVSAGVGFSYARLINVRFKEHGIDYTKTKSNEFNSNEFNILADVKIRLWQRIMIGFRYSYSLNPIRTIPEWDYYQDSDILEYSTKPYDQYNQLFTLRLTYVFNENLSTVHREEYQYKGDNPKFHDKAVARQLKKLKKKQEREARKNKQ